MAYGIKIRVWGDYACFTRPEMKTERVSYDVITPSAARGILESLYWKPEIKWVIDEITVMNPISFGNIKINEVTFKTQKPSESDMQTGNGEKFIKYTKETDKDGKPINIAQRGMMYLKNPDYVIEAHFEQGKAGNEPFDCKKHFNMALRRLREGQCFKRPYLGLRDFSANVKIVEADEKFESPLKGEVDLGYMLYDLKFKYKNGKPLNDADPIFYRPKMIDGVIAVAKYYKNEVKE